MAAKFKKGDRVMVIAGEERKRKDQKPRIGEILQSHAAFAGVETAPDLVVDPRFDDARCEIRGKYGRVDAGLEARLDAVARALGVERHEAR